MLSLLFVSFILYLFVLLFFRIFFRIFFHSFFHFISFVSFSCIHFHSNLFNNTFINRYININSLIKSFNDVSVSICHIYHVFFFFPFHFNLFLLFTCPSFVFFIVILYYCYYYNTIIFASPS